MTPDAQPPDAADEGEGPWDFTHEDTQYLTHGLHPYLASLVPQVPRKLLEMYAAPGARVLDPFAGGGAVLVEAHLAGLPSTGIDVNPLGAIIARAKTTPIPGPVLAWAARRFEDLYPRVSPQTPDFPASARVEFWFQPYMLKPLGRIRAAVEAVAAEVPEPHRDAVANLLACVFSNTVRDVSLTYRGEVRLRRLRAADLERFHPDVPAEFRLRLADAFARVSRLPERPVLPRVVEGDCRRIEAEEGAFDLVITSPPYGDIKNTIPYHQFSKNMLYWLGMGDAAVQRIRRGALGARDRGKAAPESATLQSALSEMRKPNLAHEAVCFYADYAAALREIARVTHGRVIIIIGHRILDGVVVDNAAITTDLMRALGWTLEARHERRIRKKRLHRKMGFGNNARGATIDREAILVYARRHSQPAVALPGGYLPTHSEQPRSGVVGAARRLGPPL